MVAAIAALLPGVLLAAWGIGMIVLSAAMILDAKGIRSRWIRASESGLAWIGFSTRGPMWAYLVVLWSGLSMGLFCLLAGFLVWRT